MADKAEQQMLEKIAQGDQQAFGQLVSLYGPRLYGLAFKLSGNTQMTEDVVQEVFIQIWQTREALTDVKNIGGFLFTIARNYMVNAIKKSIRERYHIDKWNETRQGYHDSADLTGLVDQAINTLSPQQKKVWIMSRREGMKYEDIAREMAISKDAVNKYLQAANKKIKEYLVDRRHLLELTLIWLLAKFFL